MIDKVVYMLSPTNKPVATAVSGDILVLKTQDCYSNQISSESQIVSSLNMNHINPATGPIYVEGAEPGDAIRVDIMDIKLIGNGVVASVASCGPLGYLSENRIKIIEFDNGFAEFNGVKFPVDPMIGVIGCTPLEDTPSGWVGDHGGNMDCNLIKKGNTLYCPVYMTGALFQLGDIHATMGNGEICANGIETPAEVTIRLTLIKGANLELPVLETHDSWYVIGNGKTFPEALDKTCAYMQKLLASAYGWDNTDAYMYMSIQGDLECCQSCIPCSINMVWRFGVPKLPGRPLVKQAE